MISSAQGSVDASHVGEGDRLTCVGVSGERRWSGVYLYVNDESFL